ncbi:hypothetical protein E2320_003399, partial [Naja naja]
MPVVLKLACGDTRIAEVIIFVIGGLFLLVPLSIVLTSYGFILHSVLQMKSGRWRKAFSTCGSHLIVISMFNGPLLWVYLIPKADSAADRDKHIAIFYVLITPLLNSVVYTLRNKDFHRAVAKILWRRILEEKLIKCPSGSSFYYIHLLWIYSSFCLTNEITFGKAQGFLYLCLPSPCGLLFLVVLPSACICFQRLIQHLIINNLICEMPVVLKLACGDTRNAEVIIFVIGGLFLLVPLSIVLTSYGFILHSVLQMKSGRWRKAFSTCGSHLIVISMFYGPLLWVYIIPKADSATDRDKQIAIFYVLITPLLNSVVYTLRNKDFHRAIAKI